MATRPRQRTYAQQMGRFTQLPRELQIEAWLRMNWDDKELVCTTRNAPTFCTSEEVWKEAVKSYGEYESDSNENLVASMLTPIIDKIFQETSIQGPKKYYVLEATDPEVERMYVKASDKREGLWKASKKYDNPWTTSLYKNAIRFYILGLREQEEEDEEEEEEQEEKEFSFQGLADYVYEQMVNGSGDDGDYQINQITMIE